MVTDMENDSITIMLGGKQYVLRYTVPRLIHLARRTRSETSPAGLGLLQLAQAAVQRNYDAIVLLMWAGLAHPDNPDLKNATVENIGDLLTLSPGETQAIVDAIALLYRTEFRPAVNGAVDPQRPAALQ